MGKLAFITYRRSDSAPVARGLREELRIRFGSGRVFMDEDTINPGQRWPDRIRSAATTATVMLVQIGPRWLAASDEFGRRRIDQKGDWVRNELLCALNSGVTVIPLLVGGNMTMPPREALPPQLRLLADCEAKTLHDDCWRENVEGLVDLLITDFGFVDIGLGRRVPLPTPGRKSKVPQLIESQLDQEVSRLYGWEPVESLIPGEYPPKTRQELRKTFSFRSFESAMEFMGLAVTNIVEMDHHPRWENQYKTLTVWFSTWAIGQRISMWDIKAAKQLDKLYESFAGKD